MENFDPIGEVQACMTREDVRMLYSSLHAKACSGNSAAITFFKDMLKVIAARDTGPSDGDGVIEPPKGLEWAAGDDEGADDEQEAV